MDCFQKASMFTFKPICQDENNAFWECYKRERVSSAEGREREREGRTERILKADNGEEVKGSDLFSFHRI